MNIDYCRLLLLILLFASCDAIDPDEEIPSYVRISDFDLTTDNATQGANTNNIRDVWVYIDNDIQGVYELPADIPILAEGNKEVLMRAGIAVNGIAATRAQYPFYEFTSESAQLIRGEITGISPSTTYLMSASFPWIEDFEMSGFSLSKTSRSDTSMFKVSKPDPNVEYGNSCGGIFMQDSHILAEFQSTFNFILPKGGAEVFLELDYKGNHPFIIGVTVVDGTSETQQSVITINPKDDWNKIYISLKDVVSSALTANSYKIFFRVVRGSAYPAPVIYLDNIKIVHE